MKNIKTIIKANLIHGFRQIIGKQNIINYVLSIEEKKALSHIHGGYLFEKGWWKSWRTKTTIDFKGEPLPWVTYSYIDFISLRLNKKMIVFEFGSGNSTHFYGTRVKFVDTVEHDENWFNKVKNKLPVNVNIVYKMLEYGGAYSKTALDSNKKYDLIIVDGRDRVNSLINSVNALNKKGVIVLDDSERDSYQEGVKYLLNNDFRKIDFWGISPGLFYNKCTSIFYRSDNVLSI